MHVFFAITYFLFLLAATITTTAVGHVVLTYPTPRTDNDYLFSFEEGVCNPYDNNSGMHCASFCGDPYNPAVNPLTHIPAGVPVTVQWNVNVVHEPYQYRLSFNSAAGGGDNYFDDPDHILTVVNNQDAVVAANNNSLTGNFSTTVTFPASAIANCSQPATPCVLQLYDLYYFVSCANVVLLSSSSTNTTKQDDGDDSDTSKTSEDSMVSSPSPAVAAEGDVEASSSSSSLSCRNCNWAARLLLLLFLWPVLSLLLLQC